MIFKCVVSNSNMAYTHTRGIYRITGVFIVGSWYDARLTVVNTPIALMLLCSY